MLKRIISRANKSRNYVLSAPIGGLNARDSLDLMKETDAITMDNYLPSETKVVLRKGYVPYVNMEHAVKTPAIRPRHIFELIKNSMPSSGLKKTTFA